MVDTGERYRATRARITDLVRNADPADLQRPVPTCPGWTVHDLVAHVTGVPDDALNGRLDGVATDPWTAAQVERSRHVPTADLIDRWSEQGPAFERLPLPSRAVIDLTTHEQDLRTALGQPGARDSEELLWAFALVADDAVGRVSGLRIEAGGTAYGPEDASTTVKGQPYELYRALLGRRSAAQLRSLDWEGGPPDVEQLVVFGPAPVDIFE